MREVPDDEPQPGEGCLVALVISIAFWYLVWLYL